MSKDFVAACDIVAGPGASTSEADAGAEAAIMTTGMAGTGEAVAVAGRLREGGGGAGGAAAAATVVLIPGDGIGPEIMEATLRVLAATGVSLNFVPATAGCAALTGCGGKGGDVLPAETVALIKEHKMVLKGPLATPNGGGYRSATVQMRCLFELFANVRPVRSWPGVESRYKDVDLILVRENTEGAYVEGGYMSEGGDRAFNEIRTTRAATERVARHAFAYAVAHGRRKVTIVHKANILKETTGLFLRVSQEVARREFPQLQVEDMLVDNCAMQLVSRPERFDVLLTPNLFGDILSDLMAGMIGGLGLAEGANFGTEYALFEAVHGTAPDIVGKHIANPCSLILAGASLLEHVHRKPEADLIRAAISQALQTSQPHQRTPDIGGTGTTQIWTDLIIQQIVQAQAHPLPPLA